MSLNNGVSPANDLLFAALTQSGLALENNDSNPPFSFTPPPQQNGHEKPQKFTVKLASGCTILSKGGNTIIPQANSIKPITVVKQDQKPLIIQKNENGYSELKVAGKKVLIPTHLKSCVIKTVVPPGTKSGVLTGIKRPVVTQQNIVNNGPIVINNGGVSLGKNFVEHAGGSSNGYEISSKVQKLSTPTLPSKQTFKVVSALTNEPIRIPSPSSMPSTQAYSSPSPKVINVGKNCFQIPLTNNVTAASESFHAISPVVVPRIPKISTAPSKVKSVIPTYSVSQTQIESTKHPLHDLADEDLNEETEVGKTFAEYSPSKLKFGRSHPAKVVETSALSSILPPDITYELTLPESIIDYGLLTSLQLEAVIYACQKHETYLPNGQRAGYLIGDGPGVGKGRTIAGIIYENYLKGEKRSLWFSVSNDLMCDAERDLRDIGAESVPVYALNKIKYGKLSSKSNGEIKKGVLFITYTCLISESHDKKKYGSRLKQIINWCGKDFSGPIIFDECHKAKNLFPSGSTRPTKTGMAVLDLQRRLPHARIVYASATGATEPRNMAYMSRIGLWGEGSPFTSNNHFIQALERGGVGAMELVAMHLKLSGSYIVRQLSFHNVSFSIDEVKLSTHFATLYDQCVKLWVDAKEAFEIAIGLFGAEKHMIKTTWTQFWAAHQRFFKYMCVAAKVDRAAELAKRAVRHGKCVVIGLQSTGEARTLEMLEKCDGKPTEFVSTTRGVFENLIEQQFPASDRSRVTDLFGKDFYKPAQEMNGFKKKNNQDSSTSSDSEESIMSDYDFDKDEDLTKIFGGESDCDVDTFSASDAESDDIDKNEVIEHKGMDSSKTKSGPSWCASSNKFSTVKTTKIEHSSLTELILKSTDPMESVQILKHEMLRRVSEISLPNNALDDLIEALGGSENVAEMTGRKGRMVLTNSGEVCYEARNDNEDCYSVNLAEKQKFMDGEKNIAIISEAASSGISLQSDKRAKNQRKRLHITLELPWSADRAVQQFGRTHRSNQVNAPEYIFLISELAGERRFASIVAKRLESLGALTHGDRRATDMRDLSRYNVDTKYGRHALDSVISSVKCGRKNLIPPPSWKQGDFYAVIRRAMFDVGILKRHTVTSERETCDIPRFLNRILGMEVAQQNALFQYFCDTLCIIMQQAKVRGELDEIKDIGEAESVRRENFYLRNCNYDPTVNNHIILNTVTVERGLSWSEAKSILHENGGGGLKDGYYVSHFERDGRQMVILCIESLWSFKKDGGASFSIYKPNTGKQGRKVNLSFITSKYKKVDESTAMKCWNHVYSTSEKMCSHKFWRGYCEEVSCMIGRRQQFYHILTGCVLNAWGTLEEVLGEGSGNQFRMQIVRFGVDEQRCVGLLVPAKYVGTLRGILKSSSYPV